MLFAVGLGVGPRDALATFVNIDTTTLAGTDARLEFTLLDGDFTANNSVTISGITTNGTLGGTDCTVGCSGGPPYAIDDSIGLGQLLQDLNLGTFVSFFLNYTTNFSGISSPDRFSLLLLDPGTNFTLVDTNLDFPSDPVPVQDALLVIDLQGEGQTQAATATTPSIGVAVPEPGTLALLALGSLFVIGRSKNPPDRLKI